MGLNISKGNMYEWVTHTWNAIKGKCFHDCSYCYVKRWGELNPVRFDGKELDTDLGTGNFIFVGSSCDMFAEGIPGDWIVKTLNHCMKYDGNSYLFQSKNPGRMDLIPEHCHICTTIETNRDYPDIMRDAPNVWDRAFDMSLLDHGSKFITIEPVMDFDLTDLVLMIKAVFPKQVNIGADSGGNGLPEPSQEKILNLIHELSKFTTVKKKKNLNRLITNN